MKKLKIKWTPDLSQDLDAMTTPGFIMYDEKLTNELIEEYGSIQNFKNSDKFKEMKNDFDKKVKKGKLS